MDNPILNDVTGLHGYYDFKPEWTPDEDNPDAPQPETSGPSLFTVLQEELGLKLDAGKGLSRSSGG